ncbi:MAG TPA: amino acid deaminase [Candidatus Aquilonibacter sp.]|nr:amino acid deaminase [Candidatus Aquilonibacter sp.]
MIERSYHDIAIPSIESHTLVSPLNKGLANMKRPLSIAEISESKLNLLREDLSLPAAVLYEDFLVNNLTWMRQFAAAYGAKLAPHGKTTMAPKLFLRQLQTGAWGITLATAQQTRAAYEHGVRRVLMANQLVGKQNMAIIADLLDDPDFEYFCLVDSATLAEQLGAFFRSRGKRLNVLIELGVDGGRTGIRNPEQLDSLLASLQGWRQSLILCGIELYEGVLDDEESIRQFLQRAVAHTRELATAECFARSPIILSGAGSAWYDVVAEELSQAKLGPPVEIVLRPGCYLTHDVGAYRKAQERIHARNEVARGMQSGLLPALQIWAYVQSVPESAKAIITLGKRDAAFDAGLPTPALRFRPGHAAPELAPSTWQLTKMMDQHAYLRFEEGDDIRVGDMIGFDISHPCLTFDKWRFIPIVNARYDVIDVVQTFF